MKVYVPKLALKCPKLLFYLNLFEISNQVLKFEKVLSRLDIYFKHGLFKVAPFACIQVYHVRLNNTSEERSTIKLSYETINEIVAWI